jgi:hypothetical protein
MTATSIEKHKLLLSHLGEEKVIELYSLFGDEKISFAGVIRYIKSSRINQELNKKERSKSGCKIVGCASFHYLPTAEKKVAKLLEMRQGVHVLLYWSLKEKTP